ncbi:MAG: hypothetical protein KA132_03920 [Thauera sp.]|nr:hypothetical protein [Thauera sp.]
MNARDNTPLRTLIADRLAAGEDTAAGIAQAIGKGDTPSIVVKELNAMRTDGQVECEQRERGKKKGLVYWLAVPLEAVADGHDPDPAPAPAVLSESTLPAGMRQGTRAAQIYRVLPAFDERPIDARAIATATGCAKALIDGALWAMVKAGKCVRHTNGVPYGYTRLPPAGGDSEGGEADAKAQSAEIPPTEAEDAAMPPADASLLALANRELSGRLARVAHVLRGSGLEGLKDLDGGADLQTAAAALTGAYQMTLASLQARGEQLLEMQDELNRRDDELLAQASTIVNLRSSIETMQREAMRGASLMSGQDRYTAAGYLVRASKRKPRTLLDKDKARDAALSSIRAGAQRAEVFALVPIDHARRGAEWRSA